MDFTPLNSSEGSTIVLLIVGIGITISVPGTEPAGKVTVVVKALKSEPSVAGLVEPGEVSTEKSTLYASSIPTYCCPTEFVPLDNLKIYCISSPSVIS